MAFHKFFKAMAEDREFVVFGDGRQTRDFTFVDDIVQANLAALDSGRPGETYNIGGGHRETLAEVIRRHGKRQPGRARVRQADRRKATSPTPGPISPRPGRTWITPRGRSSRTGSRQEWLWVRETLFFMNGEDRHNDTDSTNDPRRDRPGHRPRSRPARLQREKGRGRPRVASSDEALFKLGEAEIKKDTEKALLYLRQVIDSFPKSFYAQRAKLLIADAYFKKGDEGNMILAAAEYREFINLYPYSPSAAYCQYQIGMTFFGKTLKPGRDQTKTVQALAEFKKVVTAYPRASRPRPRRTRSRTAKNGWPSTL